jgi:hypothetical protein
LLLLLVLALLPCAPARADEAVCLDLSDEEVSDRLREVRGFVARHEPDTRHWATAFLSLHLTMVGVQLSLAVSADNEGATVDGWVGTLSSTLGVATLLISWPQLVGAGGALDALPTRTPEERRYALARAEQRMRRASDQVAFVRSPFTSILNALYVGGAGAFTLVGWGRVTGGLILAAGGSVLSQGRVLLFPTGIREEWLRYHRRHPDAGCEPMPLAGGATGPSLTVLPTGLGASMLLVF